MNRGVEALECHDGHAEDQRPDAEDGLDLAEEMQCLSPEAHLVRLAILVPIGGGGARLAAREVALFDNVRPVANLGARERVQDREDEDDRGDDVERLHARATGKRGAEVG